MTHELKTWPCYYERIADGSKTFEVRDNSDRGFQCGDDIILKEYSTEMRPVTAEELKERYGPGVISASEVVGYTGRELKFKIGYVLPLSKDRVVFSLLRGVVHE